MPKREKIIRKSKKRKKKRKRVRKNLLRTSQINLKYQEFIFGEL